MPESFSHSQEISFPDDYYIIDVGMHRGADSEYYAKRGFKVIAFEANPDLARDARAKFEQLDYSIEVRNMAISPSGKGKGAFFVNDKRDQFSSLNKAICSRGGEARAIDVETCDLGEELEYIKNKIHMIKIDIEGGDFIALSQLYNAGIAPRYISVENGGEKFVKLMMEMGYNRFKYANQRFNSKQWIPRDSVHGNVIKHFFPAHSSGPFGEDVSGRWLSPEEAITVGNALDGARKIAKNPLFAESIGWFDLHATY